MEKEKCGVDSYGSMKGPIHLHFEKEIFDKDGISNNEGEEVEKRLDHNLSRFEMLYPNFGYHQTLEKRIDEHDTKIAHLKEENLTLKERIFLMEKETRELRRRAMCLETNVIGGRELDIFHGNIVKDVCSENSIRIGRNCDDNRNGECV